PIRLMLEAMKPEMAQQEAGVVSTIVVFGSARIPDRENAALRVEECRQALQRFPDEPTRMAELRIAENLLERSRYYDEARAFGRLVSTTCQREGKCDYVIVTGGGPGIMEAANRGADDVSAKSIGLNITLPHEQAPNPYITPDLCFQFRYFAMRKMHFLLRAKALVAFPGGFGTLDELFETLTLIQTRKTRPVPVILMGREFWDRL
ncbi:MAG: LOG family protein, partial [Planctomycetaceae bacterium]|nr:LOG family protein [Planctomycetaceae bacterium]